MNPRHSENSNLYLTCISLFIVGQSHSNPLLDFLRWITPTFSKQCKHEDVKNILLELSNPWPNPFFHSASRDLSQSEETKETEIYLYKQVEKCMNIAAVYEKHKKPSSSEKHGCLFINTGLCPFYTAKVLGNKFRKDLATSKHELLVVNTSKPRKRPDVSNEKITRLWSQIKQFHLQNSY